MVVSKRLFTAVAVLALSGCMSSTPEPYASDDYYADDFAVSVPASETAPASAEQAATSAEQTPAPAAPAASPAEISAK